MDYAQTLEEAKNRLQELAAKRDAIDREMQALLRIIEGIQIITQPAEPATLELNTLAASNEPAGFTEAVRMIIGRSATPLVPTEIRDALETMGFEGSSPKHLLIHVHSVLRRLFENEEIEQVPRDGKIAYRALTLTDVMARTFAAHPVTAMLGALSAPKHRQRLAELVKEAKENKSPLAVKPVTGKA